MSGTSVAKQAYPCDIPPEIAQGMEILPGLFWVRLPLPFDLNHINVWLLEERNGWTLIDTGLNIPQVHEAWKILYHTLLDDRPIQRIIVTHLHPDHIGLACYLQQRFNAEVLMTSATEHHSRVLWQRTGPDEAAEIRSFCRSHGIDRADDYLAFITGKGYRRMISGIPDKITGLSEESTIRIGDHDWRAIITDGHAPGHMSLYCEKQGVLISGDHILPAITCNISVFASNYQEDALDAYLQSMQRFTELPEDTMVLPSHGRVFTGLHERIDFIKAHHRKMLDQVKFLCKEPLCLGEVAPKLFRRSLEGANYSLAMGETMAHLIYLSKRNEITMHEKDGVYYFQNK